MNRYVLGLTGNFLPYYASNPRSIFSWNGNRRSAFEHQHGSNTIGNPVHISPVHQMVSANPNESFFIIKYFNDFAKGSGNAVFVTIGQMDIGVISICNETLNFFSQKCVLSFWIRIRKRSFLLAHNNIVGLNQQHIISPSFVQFKFASFNFAAHLHVQYINCVSPDTLFMNSYYFKYWAQM